jgi:hypothetical protein
MMRLPQLLSLLLIITSAACEGPADDDDVADPYSGNGTLRGVVSSTAGSGIADVEIAAGGTSGTTDNMGFFMLTGVDADRTLDIFARKAGLSTGHQRVDLEAEDTVFVQLTLAPMQTRILTDATLGGRVEGGDGVAITFPEASIRNASGAFVEGAVSVQYALLNDTGRIPAAPGGMLAGQGEEEVQLESWGMVEVRLTQDGEEVALDGTAALEFPMSASSFGEGDSVGLYEFSEGLGRWVLAGTGEVQNGKFIADVDHFSWWNCDEPLSDKNCLAGRLVTPALDGIAGASISSSGIDYLSSGSATTDEDGNFCITVKRGSSNRLTAFFADDMGVYNWTRDATAENDATECALGNCTDLGDQVVQGIPYTCVTGTYAEPSYDWCEVGWTVRDELGGVLMTGSKAIDVEAGPGEFCATVPQGATIDFWGEGDPIALQNMPTTCAQGGCQELGDVSVLCEGGDDDDASIDDDDSTQPNDDDAANDDDAR